MSRAPHLPAVGQADPAPAGDVVADLADGPDRVLEGQVAQHGRGVLEHAQQDAGRAHLQEGGVLAHVGVAHDHVEAAERSASAWGSSRVLMIGRLRVVADDTPSQMCSARWLRQNTAPRAVWSTLPAPA